MKTQDAIKFFGSVKNMADLLKVSRAAIYQWGEEVPKGRQYEIQVLTNGELKASPAKQAA